MDDILNLLSSMELDEDLSFKLKKGKHGQLRINVCICRGPITAEFYVDHYQDPTKMKSSMRQAISNVSLWRVRKATEVATPAVGRF